MRVLAVSAVLLVALSTPAWANFMDGVAAYQRGDYERALIEIRPLALQGHPGAQYNICLMHRSGRGLPQNDLEAAKWCRAAAERGFAPAQTDLGLMYRLGRGVPRDDVQAVKWFRLAAEQGLAKAMMSLGGMYYRGRGVPPNFVLAHMWFNLAAASGHEKARRNRDLLEYQMPPADIAQAWRLANMWRFQPR